MLGKSRMAVVSMIVGVALGSAATAQPAAPGPQPQAVDPTEKYGVLVFDESRVDFGKVNDVDLQETEFTFVNRGDADLRIIDIKGSCSCTVAELEKRVYAPGEGGSLKVSLKTAKRRGNFGQTVTITSDDPTAPLQTLIVRANVIPLVEMSTQNAQFNEIEKSQVATREIVLTGPDEEFAVTSVRVDRPDIFEVKIAKAEPVEVEDRMNGGTKMATRTTLQITTKPDAPVGARIRSSIFIATNHKKLGTLTAFGLVSIRGDLVLEPSRFAFGVLKPGESFSREIRVRSKSGESFEISSAVPVLPVGRPMTDLLDVAIAPADDGDGYVVTLSGTAPDQPMPARGYMLINTNVPGEAIQRAGISAVVRAARATGGLGR